jgi:DNA-binding HxlR family transcriptional regulator
MTNDDPAEQQLIELLAGRLTMAVLAILEEDGCRYQDLDKVLNGISQKVLADTLRRAERDGLKARHLDPSRVETATLYDLTDLGRSQRDSTTAVVQLAERIGNGRAKVQ